MARPIVLGNGELQVGLNNFGLVHDFYFPYVGLENHAAGKKLRHMVGVFVDGTISWLDGGDWKFSFHYPHRALIGHTIAINEKIGIRLEFDDTVDSQISAFLRNIHVINVSKDEREIKLFLHQAFVIGDSASNTDTAQYLPDSDAVLHYRGRRAFVIGGSSEGKSFDQHSIGLFGIEGHEGTWRDAENGELSGNNVEHGRVDSTIRFNLTVGSHSSARVEYWIACGTNTREALYADRKIRNEGIFARVHQTAKWWQHYMERAEAVAQKIAPEFRELFLQSIMIMKSQIDKRGAVIASTDSAMLNYSRDNYAYCWPRDGAYTLWPLIRMGYTEEARRFFDFCKHGLHPAGYLMHKYRADGALGSSWHAYVHHGEEVGPPIQEDETALVVFVFAQFYHIQNDPNTLKDYFDSMIVPMADFLASYIDERTGLPKATYDLWEEVYQTTTYTVSVVYAALEAASELAELAHDNERAVAWRTAAENISAAAQKHLFNEDRGAFYKGIYWEGDEMKCDATIDASSFFGSFMYGLFPLEGDEMRRAFDSLIKNLRIGEIGLPRYEHDTYYAQKPDSPNWWPVTTLWLAQYYIEKNDNDKATDIMRWVAQHAFSTGVLPEQIQPETNAPLSVAPLTWSHAELVATLLDTITTQEN